MNRLWWTEWWHVHVLRHTVTRVNGAVDVCTCGAEWHLC